MEKNQMKNMVILKDLPSNLIEEAIVILRSNKYAKQIEYIDKKENIKDKEKLNKNHNYIIREAESVISNYINIVENKNKMSNDSNFRKKYKKLKIYSILVTLAFFMTLLF